jgi:L-alanine-DL-glutamate epimerase-like enolase superfamily enzyme
MISLSARLETYPIAGRFVIARGAKTEANVVVVTLADGAASGRGECVPYTRYGETVESVLAAIALAGPTIERDPDRERLRALLPPGAARNAIDCALWDLEAKRTGIGVFTRAGITPAPATTAFTISVGTPEAMAEAAAQAATRPLLKVKLAGAGDRERLRAVRAAAPAATLIVDANEAWAAGDCAAMLAACAEAGVALVEQPLPVGADDLLGRIPHPVPVCADESVHDRADLAALRTRYDAVNIKLDKTGGLTEALEVAREARALGFTVMAGCMVGTSLAMAPAMLLAPGALYVDLDGPLLLTRDRPDGLRFEGSTIYPPTAALWG